MSSRERPEPALARTGSEKVMAATNRDSTGPRTIPQPPNRREPCRFLADVHRRRRIVGLLDAIIADLHPSTVVPPSTFGLSDDQLRRHARDLFSAGWSLGEITAVLDVQPARTT